MSKLGVSRAVGWKHPLRDIVERDDGSNLLSCGHRVAVPATPGRCIGKGKRQRCTGCPIEPPKLDLKTERQMQRSEALAR